MRSYKTIAAAVVTVGVSLAALTGCSGGAQSVEDACGVVNKTVAEMQSEFQDASNSMTGGEFSTVVELFGNLESKLEEAAGKVTNTEVKEAVDTLAEKVGAYAAVFDGVDDGDIMALADKADDMTTLAQEFADAGQEFTELCS